MLGACLMFLGRLPEAGMHFERARQLNPNDVMIAVLHALWHCFAGHVEQAISGMQEALRRDPFGHEWFWDDYCIVLIVAQRYEEAVAAFEKMVAPAPWSYAFAAIAHVNMGNLERAKDLAKRCLEANPGFPPEDYFLLDPYIDRTVPERMAADLRKVL
jgi:tetratricopeptide (TPR) repeat protein